MKTKSIVSITTALLLSTLNSQFSALFAQGALTPPGAPEPTMKSLAQIEPRTIVNAANTPGDSGDLFIISEPGSYYLTTNVTVSAGNAITITASNVTLDLNGFTISSTAAYETGNAILLGAVINVAIYNGHISSDVTNDAAGDFGGGGFTSGISNSGSAPYNVRVKNVSVTGVAFYGIALGADTGNLTVLEGCTVNGAGIFGIVADSVSDSTAVNCGDIGIIAGSAQNCTASSVGNSTGLIAGIANNCYGSGSGSGDGLDAGNANNCYGTTSGSGYGLNADYVATGCYGMSSSGTGLNAGTADSCYGASSGNGDGLDATTANNCQGTSSGVGSFGLNADYVATGCSGYAMYGYGLYANDADNCYGYGADYGLAAAVATGCYGSSDGNGEGLAATTANNCYGSAAGQSGNGLNATTANNCYGYCTGIGIAVNVSDVATGCVAGNTGGTALKAYLANGCVANGSPAYSVTHNVNSY